MFKREESPLKKTEREFIGDGIVAEFDGEAVLLRFYISGGYIEQLALGPEAAVKLRDYLTRLTTRHDA
jgi:hypothetical protein